MHLTVADCEAVAAAVNGHAVNTDLKGEVKGIGTMSLTLRPLSIRGKLIAL